MLQVVPSFGIQMTMCYDQTWPAAKACSGLSEETIEIASLWTSVLEKASSACFGGIFWTKTHVAVMIWWKYDERQYACLCTFHQDEILSVTAVKPVVPKCNVPKSVPFGKSAELTCVEEEGFPKSHYQWFKNREEIPDDPKTSLKFFNSSYMLNSETGTLVSMCALCLEWEWRDIPVWLNGPI